MCSPVLFCRIACFDWSLYFDQVCSDADWYRISSKNAKEIATLALASEVTVLQE